MDTQIILHTSPCKAQLVGINDENSLASFDIFVRMHKNLFLKYIYMEDYIGRQVLAERFLSDLKGLMWVVHSDDKFCIEETFI